MPGRRVKMAADADERRVYCGIDPGASLSDKFVRRLLAASSNERFYMNLPSKDKLKEKYGITNDDFDVLAEFPTNEQLQNANLS